MNRIFYSAGVATAMMIVMALLICGTWGLMTLGDHLFGTAGIFGAAILLGFSLVFAAAYITYEGKEDEVIEDE